jgi:hypothetical protein
MKGEPIVATISSVSITWDQENRPLITVQYRDEAEGGPEVQPEEWLAALAERLTDKSAKNLRKLLELNGTGAYVSLNELAAEVGVERKEADGWNRNLGRSIKAVVRDHGFLRPEQEDGTAQLFDFQWDQPNNQWRYAVPEKFRPALLEALDQQ